MRYHAFCFGVAVLLLSLLPASLGARQFAIPTALTQTIPTQKDEHPLRIGVFVRVENANSVANYQAFAQGAMELPGVVISPLAPEDFASKDLSVFDVLVFPGGSPSSQGRSIGAAGRVAVRRYVRNGGSYLGICAGAFLATPSYPWSLGILNARIVAPNNWIRGRGRVDVQLSDVGRALLGNYPEAVSMVYINGPVFEPMGHSDLPPYTVVAWYRSEIAENNTPRNVMVNSPAFVHSTYGSGRVFAISPHPEVTPGLRNIVPRVLTWLATDEVPGSQSVSDVLLASSENQRG